MKWMAPIELFMDIAVFLWLWEVISHPPDDAKSQRKNRANRLRQA